MKSLLAALTLCAFVLTGCNTAPPCPPGATLKGEAPPDGEEQWCEKLVDGKPVKDGRFTLFWPNGEKMMEGEYQDGKQVGEWTNWYDNGQMSARDQYRDGVQQGPHVGWYANGQKSAEGQFVNGQKEGKWKRWDPGGFRNWTDVYKGGQRVTS